MAPWGYEEPPPPAQLEQPLLGGLDIISPYIGAPLIAEGCQPPSLM